MKRAATSCCRGSLRCESSIIRIMVGILLCAPTRASDGNDLSMVQKWAKHQRRQTAIWRKPEADAVNCLYVFLRFHDVDVSYEECQSVLTSEQRPGQPASLLDLKEVALRYDLKVDTVKCPPDSELYARLPAITLLDEARSQNKTFVLLFGMPGQYEDMYLMFGGDVCMSRLSADEFRRRWSGVVLTASAPDSIMSGFTPLWIALSVSLAFMYIARRFKRANV